MTMIFINLPVRDLATSRRFYEALGFSINEDFSDDTAASVVVSETVVLMLLTHQKMEMFTELPIGDPSRETQHLLALGQPSRAAVDQITEAAIAAGGTEPRPAQDHGWMYGRAFTDPDGHTWEPVFMDPSAMG